MKAKGVIQLKFSTVWNYDFLDIDYPRFVSHLCLFRSIHNAENISSEFPVVSFWHGNSPSQNIDIKMPFSMSFRNWVSRSSPSSSAFNWFVVVQFCSLFISTISMCRFFGTRSQWNDYCLFHRKFECEICAASHPQSTRRITIDNQKESLPSSHHIVWFNKDLTIPRLNVMRLPFQCCTETNLAKEHKPLFNSNTFRSRGFCYLIFLLYQHHVMFTIWRDAL